MSGWILGRSWAKMQMMQGASMETVHRAGDHSARIHGKDLVGSHTTEIGLCEALDEIMVAPRVLVFSGQTSTDGIIVNRWDEPRAL